MRTLLVTNRADRPRFEVAQVNAIVAGGGVTKWEVEQDGWELPRLDHYDCVVFFVKFRQLAERASIEWRGFSGLRVLMDHDSFQDYGGWWSTSNFGSWSTHMPRLGFDRIIVSGESSRIHFERMGYAAEVVSKGFSPLHFRELGLARSGIGHFGSPYGARIAMLRLLDKQQVPVITIRARYSDLNLALNERLAILVCNMTSEPRFGWLGHAVQRVDRGALMRLDPAPEPMAKNFEAAAAGCAVFMDRTPDDDSLGFIDGQTVITYSDFNELVDKLRYWNARPDELREIGKASAALCRSSHTWEKRAERFHEILEHWFNGS